MSYSSSVFDNEIHYWKTKTESKLKKEIKNEKNKFRRDDLQRIYQELKRKGVYDKK